MCYERLSFASYAMYGLRSPIGVTSIGGLLSRDHSREQEIYFLTLFNGINCFLGLQQRWHFKGQNCKLRQYGAGRKTGGRTAELGLVQVLLLWWASVEYRDN